MSFGPGIRYVEIGCYMGCRCSGLATEDENELSDAVAHDHD